MKLCTICIDHVPPIRVVESEPLGTLPMACLLEYNADIVLFDVHLDTRVRQHLSFVSDESNPKSRPGFPVLDRFAVCSNVVSFHDHPKLVLILRLRRHSLDTIQCNHLRGVIPIPVDAAATVAVHCPMSFSSPRLFVPENKSYPNECIVQNPAQRMRSEFLPWGTTRC
jgi:hypothetical protein